MASDKVIQIAGIDLKVDGHLLRTARLNDEYFVVAPDPEALVHALKARHDEADVFTFVQGPHDLQPHFNHRLCWDQMAVMRVTTYANWFDKQLTFKPRNRVRKAAKCGVDVRPVAFTDELVRGIMAIYNETPLRQGKRNWHFGKGFDAIRREHATFLERSDFIGAYFDGELIGFAKVTHGAQASTIMNIVAKLAYRDKCPSNALLAKLVETVAARQIPLLTYGQWGRRGLNDFKMVNAFECLAVPRYHVPLTAKGAWALKLDLHRGLKERVPETWLVRLAEVRSTWNEWWLGRSAAVPPLGNSAANARTAGQREP